MRNDRLIDPTQDIDRHVGEAIGTRTQRSIVQAIEDTGRTRGTEPQTVGRTYLFYRANIGGSGDAAYSMRVGTPSSDSAWAMTDIPLVMPASGVITGGDIWSTAARTTGTATLRIRVIDSAGTVDYTLDDCVINGTYLQSNGVLLPRSTIRINKGATIGARIVTASTYAPATADFAAMVHIEFDV